MTITQELTRTYEAGQVIRYHATPSVRNKQTLGHHQWNVSMLVLYLVRESSLELGLRHSDFLTPVLLEALTHDIGELFTGDIPYTFKQENPALRTELHAAEKKARARIQLTPSVELDPVQEALLKLADTLDGVLWCHAHEAAPQPVLARWLEALQNARNKFSSALPSPVWAKVNTLMSELGLS